MGRLAHDLAETLGEEARGVTVTEAVARWKERWPGVLPLPHPSPRNNRWLAANPWFETKVLPALRARVGELVARP